MYVIDAAQWYDAKMNSHMRAIISTLCKHNEKQHFIFSSSTNNYYTLYADA